MTAIARVTCKSCGRDSRLPVSKVSLSFWMDAEYAAEVVQFQCPRCGSLETREGYGSRVIELLLAAGVQRREFVWEGSE